MFLELICTAVSKKILLTLSYTVSMVRLLRHMGLELASWQNFQYLEWKVLLAE